MKNNKIAVITGGARGIGKAIATTLSQKSFDVVLIDVLEEELEKTKKEIEQYGNSVHIYRADITNSQEIKALKEQVTRDCGKIYALINNAGTFSVIAPVHEASVDKWLRDIKVNIHGTFIMTHYFSQDLVQQKDGVIINMVSAGGVGDPHPYCTSYACSKTALMRLTEGLAKELSEYSIPVFAVAPPAVFTSMTKFIMDDENGKKYRPGFDKFFEERKDESATPEDVAKRVAYLINEKRAKALTGRYIRVKDDIEKLLEQQSTILEKDLLTLRIT